MPSPPRQGNLFEQPASASHENEPAEWALNEQQLQSWQKRIHSFQSPLFESDSPRQEQSSLFGSEEAEAAGVQPLSLKPLPAEFLALAAKPPSRGGIVLGHGSTRRLKHPILLYIGETMAADRRWKGEHDCKAYLAAYQEACVHCGLSCRTSIRFWGDVPRATKARRQLEQTLIRRWQPPFNKETRDRWATPFQAD